MADTTNINVGQLPGQSYFVRLTIKGQEYISKSIISLTIREWVIDILPRLEILMYDEGTLNEVLPLEDNDIIIVQLGRHADDPNPIICEFILADYQINVGGDNRKLVFAITGYLKAADMFKIKNRCFSNSSSLDILSSIASENSIPFSNPNSVTPNDIMTWYQSWENNFDFVKHVLKRSDAINDLILFYATTENKFIYTTLNKEIEKVSQRIARYNIQKYGDGELDPNDIDQTVWFNTYDVVNYSSYYNKVNTYKVEYDYYDSATGNVIMNPYNQSQKITQLKYKDTAKATDLVMHKYRGMMNDKNIYSNYFGSSVVNDYLRNEFFSNSVVISINALCQVKLFEKLNVEIPSMLAPNESNEVLSGEYLVGGIIHQVSLNGTYRKMLSLHRNGINRSSQMSQFHMES